MFVTLLAIAMTAFGLGTWGIARRHGLHGGISRRPYYNQYTDAPGARRNPNARQAGQLDRPLWAPRRRAVRPQES
jgi:hypothetical protein